MKKAIVIGASSGIGKELAKVLSKNGYEVGLLARRTDLLKVLKEELPNPSYYDYLDVTQPDAVDRLKKMMGTLNGLDLFIFNSGVGFLNQELDWTKEKDTIDVNVYGFCALTTEAYKFFQKQGYGHIVGISSIGALRGNGVAPAYNASKAFMSNYLEGLKIKAYKENSAITITDIKPGFVDTGMAKGNLFWVSTTQKATEQIYSAITQHKSHAYISRRWRLIGWLLKFMPGWLYQRI